MIFVTSIEKASRSCASGLSIVLCACFLFWLVGLSHVKAGDRDDEVLGIVAAHEKQINDIASKLWHYSELGFLEEKSTRLLKDVLNAEKFRITENAAGLSTAFVAEWGNGKPVVGIIAEFDALPGPRQDILPQHVSVPGQSGTHACGHNLFGAASTVAAIAVKKWLKKNGQPGTVRLYGTPAHEGGSGKVYMVREGVFDDVDAIVHWHPDDENSAHARYTLANLSAKFRFRGVSAHAASSPHQGRSALDGVEAFNVMVNLMREHMRQSARIHYVISNGGQVPNTVPDYAEAYYYVREEDAVSLKGLFERITKAAQGAALGTGTEVEWEIQHGNHPLAIIEPLARMMDDKLQKVDGITYTKEEMAFGRDIQSTFSFVPLPISTSETVEPYKVIKNFGSTDVGDVSLKAPTVEVRTATWVPGTAHHSWQAAAQSGMSIGFKGAMVAAKAMALAVIEVVQNPVLLAEAKEVHAKLLGADFRYEAVLGDREPPLDYRK